MQRLMKKSCKKTLYFCDKDMYICITAREIEGGIVILT